VALVVLVAVGLAVAGVAGLRRGVDEPVAAPSPTRSPAASLPPTPVIAFGDVCRPIRTAGPDALDISFSLRNNSSRPATLVAVDPLLPLNGLLERGYTIRAGTCPATGRTLTDNRLGRARPVEVEPAGWVVATLHFALPPGCPAPYPVQAVVYEMSGPGAAPISTRYPVLPDLGEVRFPNC
jgi:hypothetical protein